MPLVPPAVKVTVAVPLACIVVCAPDNVPSTGFANVMGRPITVLRFATVTALLAELVKKLPVTVLIPPVAIEVGEAVALSCSQLAAAVPNISVVVGLVFTPHQLLSLFIVPTTPPPVEIILPEATFGALLFTILL